MTYLRRRPKELVAQERYIYYAELDRCPSCGEPLELCGYYSFRKTVQLLDKVVYVASRPKRCGNPACALYDLPQPSAQAQGVALYYSTYGLDVVAQIGWWRDREHLNGAEIHRRLQGRVQISRRHIDLLLQQYRLLLACAETPTVAQLTQIVARYGGLILSADGLEPEGAQEQLWVVREVLSDSVLAAGWLPRVNEATLTQLLTPVKAFLGQHGWSLLATLSDKQGPLANVWQTLWPDAPHQWCQSHYLRQAAEPLYERDLALKTDLRREVRQAIRTSVGQVAAAATAGPFAPQLVTGMAIAEVSPGGAEVVPQPGVKPPCGAGAPAVAPAPVSSAMAVGPTAAAQDWRGDTPTAPLLLAAHSTVPALAAPPPPAISQGVVQGYARALQYALGRNGRAPWVLGGLTMYADLQALHDSLARCLQVRVELRLRLWQTILASRLPAYAASFAEVRQGQAWVEALRQTLDEAPLPTADCPGPGSAAVARQLAQTLGQTADQPISGAWLPTFWQHLRSLSEHYWRGLFPCYDIVGLPRTNNHLESLYGQTKRQVRRQTGLQQLRRPLQYQGAWLIYTSHDETAAQLQTRLAQVPLETYQAERARWRTRQTTFRLRHRWRHHRITVLTELEAAWATAGSG
jgi:hypothetical protein